MIPKKFGPGDKIFAKVRGYPPWPARVEGVADETPSKMKYHVFFYGTNETAVCKAEELFPYVEYRDKYGKPLKKRGFNEALQQVDAELGLSHSVISPINRVEGTPEDSDQEGNLVIDETPSGAISKKSPLLKIQKSTPQPTPAAKKESKATKRKLDDNSFSDNSMLEDTEPKKGRGSLKKTIQTQPDESLLTKPSEVTRSGRKVKPKKFADCNELDNEQEEYESTSNDMSKTNSVKSLKKSTVGPTGNSNKIDDSITSESDNFDSANKTDTENTLEDDVVLDSEFLNNGILVAHTPGGQEFRLKLDLGLNRPTFKSEKARQQWEAKVLRDGKRLKSQIESGEKIPESVKKEIEQKYNARLLQMEQNKTNMILDDKKEKLTYLKIEAQLLDIDCRIKCSLTLKQADPETCLRTLDELLELKLSPLMVKKHSQVVETIKKLRKYVGNTITWELSNEEADLFATKAGMIRAKAEHVYNKIKSMFLVPYGKSFWDVFSEALTEFNHKTEHMSMEDVFTMTTDPTEKPLSEISALETSVENSTAE